MAGYVCGYALSPQTAWQQAAASSLYDAWPVTDSHFLSPRCLPTSGYGKLCVACGLRLTPAFSPNPPTASGHLHWGVSVNACRRHGLRRGLVCGTGLARYPWKPVAGLGGFVTGRIVEAWPVQSWGRGRSGYGGMAGRIVDGTCVTASVHRRRQRRQRRCRQGGLSWAIVRLEAGQASSTGASYGEGVHSARLWAGL